MVHVVTTTVGAFGSPIATRDHNVLIRAPCANSECGLPRAMLIDNPEKNGVEPVTRRVLAASAPQSPSDSQHRLFLTAAGSTRRPPGDMPTRERGRQSFPTPIFLLKPPEPRFAHGADSILRHCCGPRMNPISLAGWRPSHTETRTTQREFEPDPVSQSLWRLPSPHSACNDLRKLNV